MPPLSVTDAQLDQVFAGAVPIDPRDHAAYLRMIADLLRGVTEPGDGQVHRAVAEAQRRFFTPPADATHPPLQLKKLGRRREKRSQECSTRRSVARSMRFLVSAGPLSPMC